MKNSKVIFIVAVLLIAFGAGGFYAGMRYQQSQRGQLGNNMRQFQQRAGFGVRPVRGEIISKDDKSITVKLQDGSSKIVLLSDKTSINKTSYGSKDGLKKDNEVLVVGSENSDGSVTAWNIQLNPLQNNFGQRPGVIGE